MNHPTLQQTILNMMAFHDGQLDKSGVPYFNHPLRVMLRLGPDADEAEKHAALLHDVVEDTPVTCDILRDLGYSYEVCLMVSLLTKDRNETNRTYIYRIVGSGNIGAMRIKLADMYDNSSRPRLERCPDPEVKAMLLSMIESRYVPAIRLMKEVLGKEADSVSSEEMEVEIKEREANDGEESVNGKD